MMKQSCCGLHPTREEEKRSTKKCGSLWFPVSVVTPCIFSRPRCRARKCCRDYCCQITTPAASKLGFPNHLSTIHVTLSHDPNPPVTLTTMDVMDVLVRCVFVP
ncbi:unnamed protein product [Scytosiphon promiscuus]